MVVAFLFTAVIALAWGHSPEDLERMIEVSWDGSSGESFHVGIDIQAYDRAGILMEVMAVLSELKNHHY